jgi:hypothetical protein
MAWSIDSNRYVTTSIDPKRWFNVKQGEEWACSFMAAITSILFYNRSLTITPITTSGTPKTYSVDFYNYTLNSSGVWVSSKITVYVDEYLPSCTTNGPLVWATDYRDNKNIWIGIYEKAYGALCSSLSTPVSTPGWPICPSNSSNPPFPGATLPIRQIIECIPCNPTTNLLDCIFPSNNLTALKSNCLASGKIIYPTIAWTTSLASGSPSYLTTDHAYSVLGLYPNKGGATDVILRDPSCAATNSSGPVVNVTWITQTGFPQPTLNKDGIFTIPLNDFSNYIASFGYCTPK